MTSFKHSLVLILILACCRPASEERHTAELFLKYLSQGNYPRAQQYVHPSSLPLMVDFESIGVSTDTMRVRPVSWNIDSIVKPSTDSAWVFFTWNQLPEKMLLVKEKRHWMVVF
ncbi:MAG: hypothetical protein ACP5O2_08110 [Bacteroidales bacterium]